MTQFQEEEKKKGHKVTDLDTLLFTERVPWVKCAYQIYLQQFKNYGQG